MSPGGDLRTRIPVPLRRMLHVARVYPETWRVTTGRRSRSGLWRMLRSAEQPAGPPVPVRVRALSGAEVWLRPGTLDAEVAVATFGGRYHLPPAGHAPPRLIWDIGSNIGLTMRHMAVSYPTARLVGVELDRANAELARCNLAPVADRCEVINAAVWCNSGEVRYSSADPSDGFHVQAAGDRTVDTITMNELLQLTGPPDYVKMDIEGGERTVLREATEWAPAVRALSVECHPPYSLAECARDLERLGFTVSTRRQTVWRRARDCAIGVHSQR